MDLTSLWRIHWDKVEKQWSVPFVSGIMKSECSERVCWWERWNDTRVIFQLRCSSPTHPEEREWEGLSLFVIKYLQAAAFHTRTAEQRGRRCVWEKGSSWLKRRAAYCTGSVPGVWATLCVCVCPWWFLHSYTSCVGQIGLFPDPPWPSTLEFPDRPHPPTPLLPHHPGVGAPAVPMMKEEGLLSRRRFSTCGGTASLRPPHPDGRKLIRNASFGGYNELSPISLPGWCTMVWRLRWSSTLGNVAGLLVYPVVLPSDWQVLL